MLVPYFDLKKQFSSLRDEIREALDRVCSSTSFVLGEEVNEFEKEFAAYCEVKYCVALNSGTSALHLALLALGVKPGDEVITTPNTFIATAEAICYAGAKPVFVDIDPKTANLDSALIEPAITERTKAILPVHLYGRPVDMDSNLGNRAKAQLGGYRRRLPGARRSLPGQASRKHRPCCGLQFLSEQESERLWRRWSAHDE